MNNHQMTPEQIAMLKELFGKTLNGGKTFDEICKELIDNNKQLQADSLRTSYIFSFCIMGVEPAVAKAASGNWYVNTADAMRVVIKEKLGL